MLVALIMLYKYESSFVVESIPFTLCLKSMFRRHQLFLNKIDVHHCLEEAEVI